MQADLFPAHWTVTEASPLRSPRRPSLLCLPHWLIFSFVPKLESPPTVCSLKDISTLIASILPTSPKCTPLGFITLKLPFLILPAVPAVRYGSSKTHPMTWFLISVGVWLFSQSQAVESSLTSPLFYAPQSIIIEYHQWSSPGFRQPSSSISGPPCLLRRVLW